MPRSVCRGDTVTASWSATGDVRLMSRPDLEGTGEQRSTGKQKFVVRQPTRFKLVAAGLLGTETAAADVSVAPRERGYGYKAQCSAGGRLISTKLRLSDQISGQLRVDTVGNPLDRPLRVSKGGQAVRITPHGQSAAFRGMPLHGVWRLASPLEAGETCGAALRDLRQRLVVHVSLQCGD